MGVIACEGREEDADVVGLRFLEPVVGELLERRACIEGLENRLAPWDVKFLQSAAHGPQGLEIGGVSRDAFAGVMRQGVCHLVPDHRRKLIIATYEAKQSGEHNDLSRGKTKCIDAI